MKLYLSNSIFYSLQHNNKNNDVTYIVSLNCWWSTSYCCLPLGHGISSGHKDDRTEKTNQFGGGRHHHLHLHENCNDEVNITFTNCFQSKRWRIFDLNNQVGWKLYTFDLRSEETIEWRRVISCSDCALFLYKLPIRLVSLKMWCFRISMGVVRYVPIVLMDGVI